MYPAPTFPIGRNTRRWSLLGEQRIKYLAGSLLLPTSPSSPVLGLHPSRPRRAEDRWTEGGKKKKTNNTLGQPLLRPGSLPLNDKKKKKKNSPHVLSNWQQFWLTLVMPPTLLPNHQGPFPTRGEVRTENVANIYSSLGSCNPNQHTPPEVTEPPLGPPSGPPPPLPHSSSPRSPFPAPVSRG